MKAGWALEKSEKWADSVPEFEAALKAIPSAPRALGELGWSAMNAGDLAKARKADEEAVLLALDPIVKAQGLYNLGVVQEKTGDKDGALRSFLASLQLRPNKTVEAEVGKLGASPTAKPVWCSPGKKPCDCLGGDPGDGSDFECQEVTNPAPPVTGWHVYHTHHDMWFDDDYLLDERGQLVAVIAETFQRPHESDSIQLVKAEVKTIAGHQVLRLETSLEADSQYGSLEDNNDSEATEADTSLSSRNVTICVVGDAKTPTSCPLQDVLLSESSDHSVASNKPNAKIQDAKTERATDISIADDGTVTVKLVKGSSDPGLAEVIGPHKLW
jgi:tetratricopeptide (TPR) repeat protein